MRESHEAVAAPASGGALPPGAAPAGSRRLPLLLCLVLAALAYRELATWNPRESGLAPLVAFFFSVSDTFPQIVLALVAALVLLRWSRLQAARGPGGPVALAGGCLLAGAGLFLWAQLVSAPDLELLSLIPVAVGSAWLLFGGGVAARLLAPLAILVFAVPPPGALTNQVVYPLQLWTAQLGALLVRAVGVAASVEGDMVFVPGSNFQVIESCSGLRSIQTLLLLAAVYAALFSLPRLHAAILLAAAPFAAFGMNAIRTLVLILTPGSHVHEMHVLQGALMFLVGSFALGIFDLTLLRVLPAAEAAAPRPRAPAPRTEPRRIAALCGVLGFLGAASLWAPPAWRRAPPLAGPQLPAELAGWKARPIAVDAQHANVAFEREGESVVVLLVHDDRSIRSRSLLSPKTMVPGPGWEVGPEDVIELEPGPVRARAVLAEGYAQRSLVYLVRGGTGSVLGETLRSALALDQSPFARREPAWLVRLGTEIPPGPQGLRAAEVRLRELFERLAPSLPFAALEPDQRGPSRPRSSRADPRMGRVEARSLRGPSAPMGT